MESLKALAARSVAARVTSKECLQRLEVPKSLFGDLLLAHEDSWRKLRIKKQTMCENRSAEKKSRMVNMKHDCRIKGVFSEKSLSKKKNVESVYGCHVTPLSRLVYTFCPTLKHFYV